MKNLQIALESITKLWDNDIISDRAYLSSYTAIVYDWNRHVSALLERVIAESGTHGEPEEYDLMSLATLLSAMGDRVESELESVLNDLIEKEA